MSRIRLKSMSATEAQSVSIIAQRAMGIPVTGLGNDPGFESDRSVQASISISPMERSDAEAREETLVIRLQWSGAQFVIAMTASNALVLLKRLCLNAPFGTMPHAWQAALDHLIADWVSQSVAQLGRGHPDLLEITRQPAGAPLPHLAYAFEVLLDADGHGVPTVSAELHSDSLGVHLTAGLCGGLPAAAEPGVRRPLSHRIPLTVGSTRLPAATVRSLKPGTVVFVEHARFSTERLFWLAIGGNDHNSLGFVARYDDLSITLLRGPMENTNPMSETGLPGEPDVDADVDLTPVSLDNLPVTLSFDCGSVTLTLAQIEQLAPGQVIPTARPINDYVNIRANGAVIGRGVLMEVDGRLAVNITDLSTASTPVSAQSISH